MFICADYATFMNLFVNKEGNSNTFLKYYNECRQTPINVPMLSSKQEEQLMNYYEEYSKKMEYSK